MILKLVFTASQLKILHSRNSVENKAASSLVQKETNFQWGNAVYSLQWPSVPKDYSWQIDGVTHTKTDISWQFIVIKSQNLLFYIKLFHSYATLQIVTFL